MGIFDKAKDLAADHTDVVSGGIDKAADLADEHTGGKYSDQIDQGADTVKEQVTDYLAKDEDAAQPAE